MNKYRVRHVGFFVNDIALVSDLLMKMGFTETYSAEEVVVHVGRTTVKKFDDEVERRIELIEDPLAIEDSCHICFEGSVPDFMFGFRVKKGIAGDPNIDLHFVYIDDAVYFEFAKEI